MIELVPESYVDLLEPGRIFARDAPLHVDLGCGDGSFLLALAKRHPAKNFLGIERLLGRARTAAEKATRLDNIRVLRIESFYAVRFLLPPASVETFYLLFPDPWPKRRHQRRRIVNDNFLNAIYSALVADGKFHIATDQLDYFAHMQRLALGDSQFESIGVDDVDLPPTKFECRFQEQGTPIYRLGLRKIPSIR